MRWNKSIILSIILFIIATGFTILKVQDAVYVKKQYNCVSIRFQKQGVIRKVLDTAIGNEKSKGSLWIPEITAWSFIHDAKIKNTDLNRSKKVWVNIVSGDMSLTAPMTLQYGNFVYQEDLKGCVIDTDTAFELYGTQNAVGNTLEYRNIKYYIRGVVKTPSHIMLVESNDKSAEYTNLEMVYQNKEQGEKLAEEFLLQNGFPQNYIAFDGCIYGRMISTIYGWPIWIFLLVLCIWISKGLWKNRHNIRFHWLILYFVINVCIMIGYGSLLYHFTGDPLYIPDKYIPSRFSDFDFWVKQYTTMKDEVYKIRYMTPNPRDVFLENEISKLSLNFIVMGILDIIFLLQLNLLRKYKK